MVSQFDVDAVFPRIKVSAVELGNLNIVLFRSRLFHPDLFSLGLEAWAHNLLEIKESRDILLPSCSNKGFLVYCASLVEGYSVIHLCARLYILMNTFLD